MLKFISRGDTEKEDYLALRTDELEEATWL